MCIYTRAGHGATTVAKRLFHTRTNHASPHHQNKAKILKSHLASHRPIENNNHSDFWEFLPALSTAVSTTSGAPQISRSSRCWTCLMPKANTPLFDLFQMRGGVRTIWPLAFDFCFSFLVFGALVCILIFRVCITIIMWLYFPLVCWSITRQQRWNVYTLPLCEQFFFINWQWLSQGCRFSFFQ